MTATALLAAACLFALGCFGVLVRRQPAGVVMAAQLLWLAVVLVLVAVNQPAGRLNRGQGFALLIAVAGLAQVAAGLALAQHAGPDRREREEARPGRAG